MTPRMGPMLVIAVILSQLASMPRLDTMYPSSLLLGTPNVHFSGFSLMLNLLRFANVVLRVATRLSACGVLTTMSST